MRSILLCALLFAVAGHSDAAEILISKSARTLRFSDGGTVRTFAIALGSSPVGTKTRRGDHRTPEGHYFVTHRNPRSRFFLSIGISYPNTNDADAGLRAGVISKSEHASIADANAKHRLPPQNTKLGGDLFIHGGGTGYDWTWGCVALDDDDMLFLFRNVKAGDSVEIVE
jgi:murein L,D-transpeptidase YafK